MALEERQRQIREGAGLEESRLNTEFIDWLKKYSTPIMLVIAVVAGGYALYHRYQKKTAEAMDAASVELEAALDAANPTNLIAVATDHASRGGLPLIARLNAADLHLDAGRTGVPIGTALVNGALPADLKLLTPEERTAQFTKAGELYQSVLDAANSTTGQQLVAVNAALGLAAVAESKGDIEKAKQAYAIAKERASKSGFEDLAALADKRVSTIDSIKEAPKVYAQNELHASAVKPVEQPFTSGLTNIQLKDAQGNPINATPVTAPTTAPLNPPPAPAPTPAPAEAPKP